MGGKPFFLPRPLPRCSTPTTEAGLESVGVPTPRGPASNRLRCLSGWHQPVDGNRLCLLLLVLPKFRGGAFSSPLSHESRFMTRIEASPRAQCGLVYPARSMWPSGAHSRSGTGQLRYGTERKNDRRASKSNTPHSWIPKPQICLMIRLGGPKSSRSVEMTKCPPGSGTVEKKFPVSLLIVTSL